MKDEIKDSHSIAWGYALFGLLWMAILMVVIVRHYGIEQPDQYGAHHVTSGVILFLIIMASVNIIMAIAAWQMMAVSKTKQRIIFGFAILLASGAVILFLQAITPWSLNIMPEWYSPAYNGFPLFLCTYAYWYFACSLGKLLRIPNNGVRTVAD